MNTIPPHPDNGTPKVKKPGAKISWSASLTLIPVVFTLLLCYLTNWPWLLWWLLAINITTATAFFLDKRRAVRFPDNPAKRIPEVTLLWLVLIGGTIGGFAVMLYNKHKTRDRKFIFYLTGIIIIQAIAIGFLIARHFYHGGT